MWIHLIIIKIKPVTRKWCKTDNTGADISQPILTLSINKPDINPWTLGVHSADTQEEYKKGRNEEKEQKVACLETV